MRESIIHVRASYVILVKEAHGRGCEAPDSHSFRTHTHNCGLGGAYRRNRNLQCLYPPSALGNCFLRKQKYINSVLSQHDLWKPKMFSRNGTATPCARRCATAK